MLARSLVLLSSRRFVALAALALAAAACSGDRDPHAPEVGTTAQAATVTLTDCLATSLVSAIEQANATPEADTIVLQAGCTYSFNVVNNRWYGPNALPPITSDITIEGNGATIRQGLGYPGMRLFYVARADLPQIGRAHV